MTTPHKQIYTIQETARALGIGSITLFKKLRDRNILDAGNVPYPRYVQAGFFKIQRTYWRHPETGDHQSLRALVTAQGIDWIEKQLCKGQNDAHQNPPLFG